MRISRRWFDVDYLSVATLIFFAGGATLFSRSVLTLDSPFGIIAYGLLIVVLFIKHRLAPTRQLAGLITGFLIYYLIVTLKFQAWHYKFLALYPFDFLLVYAVVAGLGKRFFEIYERILVWLAGISIFFWVLLIASPALADVLSRISPLEPYSEKVQAHILVYTIINESVNSFLPRNSGFAWEPGAFSVFCCLAIFVNLIRTKFRWRRNWSLLVLTLAVATTQSTTGYSILLLMGLMWLLNVRGQFAKFVAIPIALTVGLYVGSLPFMYEKIQGLFAQDVQQLTSTANRRWNKDQLIYAQRIASFRIDFLDFQQNPILGYGGQDEEMWTRKAGLNLISISGIGKIMAKFGIVGLAFFAFSLWRSSKQLAIDFGFRGGWILAALILEISVSYSLVENPLLMCFWLYGFFRRRHRGLVKTQNPLNV